MIGLIVKAAGSFGAALRYAGAVGIIGAVACIVIAGPLRRITG